MQASALSRRAHAARSTSLIFHRAPRTPPVRSLGSLGTLGATYTVKRGDTLSKIASANKTTVDALLRANPSITNKNLIRVGQVLNLPSGGASAPAPTSGGGTTQQRDPNIVPVGTRVSFTGTASFYGWLTQTQLDDLVRLVEKRAYKQVKTASSWSQITIEATVNHDKVNLEAIRDVDMIGAIVELGRKSGGTGGVEWTVSNPQITVTERVPEVQPNRISTPKSDGGGGSTRSDGSGSDASSEDRKSSGYTIWQVLGISSTVAIAAVGGVGILVLALALKD